MARARLEDGEPARRPRCQHDAMQQERRAASGIDHRGIRLARDTMRADWQQGRTQPLAEIRLAAQLTQAHEKLRGGRTHRALAARGRQRMQSTRKAAIFAEARCGRRTTQHAAKSEDGKGKLHARIDGTRS